MLVDCFAFLFSQAYNLGLDEFESGLFDPLRNIVEMYAFLTRIMICDSLGLCICRDLSFNNVNKLPSLSFVNLPRLQRLYVRHHNIMHNHAMCMFCHTLHSIAVVR